jgi:formylglycine-generating enzyme required for sulfatase activity
MTTRIQIICPLVLALLVLANFLSSACAQEVPVPDPGLNAAIREALQKPTGPLTEQDMLSLTVLSACCRGISSIQGLEAARNLTILDLHSNLLTNCVVPDTLTNLHIVDLFQNQLTSFVVPAALSKLTIVDVAFNSLTQCSLPNGLTNLDTLFLEGNLLTNFTVPAGLSRLTQLDLSGNELTSLTLPPDLTTLTALFVNDNPLTTFVLSEPLAATNLAGTVSTLKNQSVNVFTYPLVARLVRPLVLIGAFKFGITGPPGVYNIIGSTNLTAWSAVGVANNPLGSVNFVDGTAHFSPQKFYRARLQGPPANMVFVPPNTFTMGSPTNDLDSSSNERPQTTVTLTRGFWIGKFEVTQGEYLDVTGTNPSDFPGDLSRPISSVSWIDATNYCWRLTQRELAAGRIPAGSQYRLPTEAEWECAARAGTTTRFSYGDDPTYASTTNYAWFLDLGHPDLTVHPVGQKLPNPWGLYDVHGNVWEWCQDNYGPLPGGVQTDPAGPASTLLRDKVMRGGAYDYPNSSCRSASRLFRFPLWPDSDVGFRVVLVSGP